VKQGIAKRPSSYECITSGDTVLLAPGESVDLLFKFLTFRRVSADLRVPASPEIVQQRNISLILSCDQQIVQAIEINLQPVPAAIDHTFRYNEPENSYFRIRIPPFMQFSQQNLTCKVSKYNAHATIEHETSEIHVSSKTGEALETIHMLLFLYADPFFCQLFSVVAIEVTSLSCVYS
jgi:hypothetical protein